MGSQIQVVPQQIDDNGDGSDNETNDVEDVEDLEDAKDEAKESSGIGVCSMVTSYAFAAFPDQRLLGDGKCSPYVLDDNFRWTIVHGAGVCPQRLENRNAGYHKIRAAAMISDGAGHTFCVYGTKDGLFYNQRDDK